MVPFEAKSSGFHLVYFSNKSKRRRETTGTEYYYNLNGSSQTFNFSPSLKIGLNLSVKYLTGFGEIG